MTPFARLEAGLSASVDRTYAEMTEIIPRKAGEVISGISDPKRKPRAAVGVIDFQPIVAKLRDKSEYDGFRPEVDGDKVHVSYETTQFGDEANWPRVKDHIKAVDRPGKPVFQVVTVEADGIGRIVVRCVPFK